MTSPINFIFNIYTNKQEDKIEVPTKCYDSNKIKLDYKAKPYYRSNKNYNKGYIPKNSCCPVRPFNGCSNKSYKK